MQIPRAIAAVAVLAAVAACAPKATTTTSPTLVAAQVTAEAEAKASVDPCIVQAEQPVDLPNAINTGDEARREAPEPKCPDEPSTPQPTLNPDVTH